MDPGTRISTFAASVPNGGDNLETISGGVMLLLVGLALLVVGGSRLSRLGAAGIMLWGATLVVPIVAGK